MQYSKGGEADMTIIGITSNKKINNKGVTLIEFLIALAVGSIVLSAVLLLVTQSVRGYQSQTILAQLQSDADITMNQVSDNIMEAGITMPTGGSGNSVTVSIDNFLESGVVTDTTNKLILKNNVVYLYDKDAAILYLAADASGNDKSIVCKNVSAFGVKIVHSGITVPESGGNNGYITALNNPIQLEVTLSLQKEGKTRTITRNVSLRNSLTDIKVLTGANETGLLNTLRTSISDQYFQ